MKGRRPAIQSELQNLKKGDILGYIVVLVTNPLLDSDSAFCRAVNHEANSRRAGIAERATINVRDEIGDVCHLSKNA